MLPTITFGQKYCRSSHRTQHEIQEQCSHTEEQATSNTELIKHEYYTSRTLKDLSHFHDLLTAELRDYADPIKFKMSQT